MANIFLNAGERFLTSNYSYVFGNMGKMTETIAIDGLPTVIVDQQVERVELAQKMTAYRFAIQGNQAFVYQDQYLLGKIAIQADTDGTQIAFADGATHLKITALNQATLGGQGLEHTPTTFTPTLLGAAFDTMDKTTIIKTQTGPDSIILVGYSQPAPETHIDISPW